MNDTNLNGNSLNGFLLFGIVNFFSLQDDQYCFLYGNSLFKGRLLLCFYFSCIWHLLCRRILYFFTVLLEFLDFVALLLVSEMIT